MNERSTLARLATCVAVVVTSAAFALPASASTARGPKGRLSAAAIAAWSASYRAKERVYQAQLAGRTLRASLPPPAAIQAWSDDYRAMQDVYLNQQLADVQGEAAAFHFGDAVVGGGVVLALATLTAAGFYVLRNRRLNTVPW